MGKRLSSLEVDPLSLPPGMRVGSWRIRGWRGRGAYGTVYRAEREGREAAGPFALKLAIYPRDERFAREAELLSRIHSRHVPRLHDQGLWEHPSGAFPFLVLDWVEGVPLYEWAARRNPSSRQVLRLLSQVAWALDATHRVGGVHRDVKGENVLVRPADAHAFLMDFGAGDYKGAATLTSRLLPPGTAAYRSPEAWSFQRVFSRHPTAHYEASACDDLFALGITAYRLVTDEYPPPTCPEERGAEVWREEGDGPLPARALNPKVCPDLEGLILRLLAVPPVERFNGQAQEAAEALERAVASVGPEADAPLFLWDSSSGSRRRALAVVRRAAERDAAAKAEIERRELEEKSRPEAAIEQPRPHVFTPVWVRRAAASLGGLAALLVVAWLYGARGMERATSGSDSREGGIVAVGDGAIAAPVSTLAPMPTAESRSAVGLPMREKPFEGQRKPPCTRHGEVEIRDGCWYRLADAPPPCKEDAYDWNGACYLPSFPTRRQPTSDPP
ncbi:MAG: serine/threonine protein kinase [Myxococcaceae bacterium]|nr:serine/threonine protein kinase [Myxococcaceae bacterium]